MWGGVWAGTEAWADEVNPSSSLTRRNLELLQQPLLHPHSPAKTEKIHHTLPHRTRLGILHLRSRGKLLSVEAKCFSPNTGATLGYTCQENLVLRRQTEGTYDLTPTGRRYN